VYNVVNNQPYFPLLVLLNTHTTFLVEKASYCIVEFVSKLEHPHRRLRVYLIVHKQTFGLLLRICFTRTHINIFIILHVEKHVYGHVRAMCTAHVRAMCTAHVRAMCTAHERAMCTAHERAMCTAHERAMCTAHERAMCTAHVRAMCSISTNVLQHQSGCQRGYHGVRERQSGVSQPVQPVE